jgi:DeoR/GlpR family transcriptional regulator of sugar metabolism
MELTRKEDSVVKRLRSRRVLDMKSLCDKLDVSHMTVVRSLKKYGYHSSINQNGAFYTLHDIPSFDNDG